jgi:hypothetical protein
MKSMAIKISRRIFVSLLASVGSLSAASAGEQTQYVIGVGTLPLREVSFRAALTLANPYQTNEAFSPIYI